MFGVAKAENSRKALAFIVHIKPNLPQLYDDDDTTQYLVALMPKALKGAQIDEKTSRKYRQAIIHAVDISSNDVY